MLSQPGAAFSGRQSQRSTTRVVSAQSPIAQRDGSAGRPGVAAQDGHEQFVVPLALPAESMPQASLKSEAALLVDPLGARIEVVDPKAHPVQTARAQRLVDN
jgi:hypothetical protein